MVLENSKNKGKKNRLITTDKDTWDDVPSVPLSRGTTKCLNRQYRPNSTRGKSSCRHM
jgi:hypothetical protein